MALGVEVEGVAVRDKARRNQKANKIQATTRPAPNFLRSLLLSGWQQRPFYFLTTVPSSALYLEAGQGLFYWGGGVPHLQHAKVSRLGIEPVLQQ